MLKSRNKSVLKLADRLIKVSYLSGFKEVCVLRKTFALIFL